MAAPSPLDPISYSEHRRCICVLVDGQHQPFPIDDARDLLADLTVDLLGGPADAPRAPAIRVHAICLSRAIRDQERHQEELEARRRGTERMFGPRIFQPRGGN